MATTVRSPVSGTVVALPDVPDPVFAAALVGPGIAVEPALAPDCDVLAPVDGTVVKLHPHAFVVQAPDAAVLVHLGIDTVELRGAGFTAHVAEGDAVVAGARVLTWDPQAVAAGGRSVVCPVVVLAAAPEKVVALVSPGEHVEAGVPLLSRP